MYKVVWFARFREDLERSAARRHWAEVHGPLGRKVPQMEAYVQSHVVESLGEGAVGYDGYSCSWFADEEAFNEGLGTPEWAALGADSDNVFDWTSFEGMSAVLDERTIVDGGYGPFKAVWVVRFTDEIRSDPDRVRKAHEYWIETHGGKFGRDVPGIGRYVQNHCVVPLDPVRVDESVELAFDGFSECWFEDRAAYERATTSPEWLAMNEDAVTFCDVPFIGRMSAIVEENVVKGRGLAAASR